MTAIESLRQPLSLPGETLPNRLAKAAMTEGLADFAGRPSAGLARLYETWAKGGCGLLVTGNVIVDRDHLERPGNVVLDREPDAETRALFQAWTKAARSEGAGFWMQISHGGRQTMRRINPHPKSASDVALAMPGGQFARPTPLTEPEILAIVERFANAARVARETGFTGVQIHAAHGYLISQFLSPLSNRRSDAWGGSLENRARFLLAIVKRAREQVGYDFTVAVKLNSADFQRGGFAGGESIEVARRIAEAGVDVIEISGGNYEQPQMMGFEGADKPEGIPASTAAREAYFLDFAVEMRRALNLPLMVTGGFRTAAAMARAVEQDGVALIGLGRPLCVDTAAGGRLLAGQAALDRWEDRLKIGPGIFGPRSPFGMMRTFNWLGTTYWFYQQLRRIAEGQAPDEKLSVMKALQREQAVQTAWLKARVPEM
jgi:2,4-dienoyl-CoA reductase-like NADH-dependent reductase (Old Yellow Enzyme family)